MEDLSNAINIINNQNLYDKLQLQKAKEYCNDFVDNNFQNWHEFFIFVGNMTNPEVIRFWALNALTEIVDKKHHKLPLEEKQKFFSFAIGLLVENPQSVLSQRNFNQKYCQFLSLAFQRLNDGVAENLFDQLIQNIIVPLQSQINQSEQGYEIYMNYYNLLISTLIELNHSLKTYDKINLMESDRLRKLFFLNNVKVIDFLLALIQDFNTPIQSRTTILSVIDKLSRDNQESEYVHGILIPIAEQMLESELSNVIANSIKYLRSCINQHTRFDLLSNIMMRVFGNIQQWALFDDTNLFYQISKLLARCLSHWQYELMSLENKGRQKRTWKNKFAFNNINTLNFDSDQDEIDDDVFEQIQDDHDLEAMRLRKKMNSGKSDQQMNEEKKISDSDNSEIQFKKNQIYEMINQVFTIALDLFQLDNLKTQGVIADLFTNFVQLNLKVQIINLESQIISIIQHSLEKLRYPHWFDVTKKSSISDDEEKFLDIRESLFIIIGSGVNQDHLYNGLLQYLDMKIQNVINNQKFLDVREMDVIFAIIHTILFKRRNYNNNMQFIEKYEFIIFHPVLVNSNCTLYAEYLIEIYNSLGFQDISEQKAKHILDFLFSKNGLLSSEIQLQQQSSMLFMKEFRQNHQKIISNFAGHLLTVISENLFSNLQSVRNLDKKDFISEKIFQVFGSLLCEDSVDIQMRINLFTQYLQKTLNDVKAATGDIKRQIYMLNIISYLVKGFRQPINDQIKLLFSMFLDTCFQEIIKNGFDQIVSCRIIELVSERASIFKDINLQIHLKYLYQIIESDKLEIQATYFKVFNTFNLSVDAQVRVLQHTFETFQLQLNYVIQQIGIVREIRTERDKTKIDITEEILKTLREACNIDYLFLLCNGEDVFLQFLNSLNELYVNSFAPKIKFEAIQIIQLILSQFFKYDDEEFFHQQAHQRSRLSYNPPQMDIQFPNTIQTMMQFLEFAATNYYSLLTHGNYQEINDKIASKIILIQDISLKTLDREYRERMRHTMKNVVKIQYSTVLENLKILDQFQAKKISKNDMVKLFIKCMQNYVEEKALKNLDD
ncbi:UNKNOWN [Stylonychia lemnae]|uniref:Uncharacterized protein n=1 Tax=Stylonychia lemnae TaxID=5949 RepID=A0A078AVI1_STYLE|nr:UNKNOWN [Stylonychia lemnae]|eukprot:CDW86194.1 UNKNOWN [Stylonychia lemnae]